MTDIVFYILAACVLFAIGMLIWPALRFISTPDDEDFEECSSEKCKPQRVNIFLRLPMFFIREVRWHLHCIKWIVRKLYERGTSPIRLMQSGNAQLRRDAMKFASDTVGALNRLFFLAIVWASSLSAFQHFLNNGSLWSTLASFVIVSVTFAATFFYALVLIPFFMIETVFAAGIFDEGEHGEMTRQQFKLRAGIIVIAGFIMVLASAFLVSLPFTRAISAHLPSF